jgi:transcriptional regulator with XRE-family HTH domain
MSTKEPPNYPYTKADQRRWKERVESLTFGQAIKAHRLSQEWSLVATAEELGISKQQLSDYEHGRKLPSLEKAYGIGQVLGIMPEIAVLLAINDQLRKANIPLKVTVAK